MMTRTRYIKMLIGVAIGNQIGILIHVYLSGQPWTAFISIFPAVFGGLAIVVLLTWGTWTINADDGQE